MINMITDEYKASFLKTSRKVKRGQGPFLEIPLLSVYEKPEEDTYVKEQQDSCLLNIPIYSFSM